MLFYSGAPAAKGCHAEPHTYRTRAFIFSWSSLSVAYGSQAPTYAANDNFTKHGAHTGPPMHAYTAYTSAV